MVTVPKTNPARQSRDKGKKPFIVTIEPRLMAGLSPRACKLLIVLLRRADGHSGELKIPRAWNRAEPYWFKGTDFEKWAGISKPTRLLAMKELEHAGFITIERPRVWRTIDGRLRAVAGPTLYTLHRQPVTPKKHQKAAKSSKVKVHSVLQKSTFSTVKEVDRQIIQTTPCARAGVCEARRTGFVLSEAFSGSGSTNTNHHQHHQNCDDDFPSPCKETEKTKPKSNPPVEEEPTHAERILARAQAILEKRGENPDFVKEALALIDERSQMVGAIPASPNYYVVAYEVLLDAPDDLAEVTDLVIEKQRLRAKFMSEPIAPSEGVEEKIAFIHQVVEEAARIGRPAREVLDERLAAGKGPMFAKRRGSENPAEATAASQ